MCAFSKSPDHSDLPSPRLIPPQLVGLGPYHHLQPQLLEMERVKLEVGTKLHKESSGSSFIELTKKLTDLHLYVRAMPSARRPSSRHLFLLGLADHAGKKLAEDAILRDVMVLENQISIFFLAKMVTVTCTPLEVAERKTVEENFLHMLVGFCKSLAAQRDETVPVDKALKRAHLLDLLYIMVVKKEDEFKIDIPDDIISIEEHKIELLESLDGVVPPSNNNGRTAPPAFISMTEGVLNMLRSPSLPFAEKIRLHAMMAQGIMKILSQQIGASALDSFGHEEAPPEEKALIPTASSLAKAGVKFRRTNYVEETLFDEKTQHI
ncbi:hypothetical protein NL676_023628 [Syzygium grande]|nr:hypothetical protein NL676_023628 [Syzygium grande]